MKSIVTAVVAAFAILVTGLVSAHYPEKPVTFIIPFPPGDLEDVLTRIIAEDFQEEYGVATAVVNKPGGAGGPFPGAIEVAQAEPDGYTIGSFVIAVPVVGHQIDIPELTPEKFDPLGIFVTYPFIIAAAKDAPYNNINEMAEYAKNNKLALGHFGAPLVPTRVTFAYAKLAGFEWGSEAAFDKLDCNTLAAGDADVINTTIQLVRSCLNDIKVLASVTSERISLTPNAPTMGELFPELNIALWNGLFVRKETPQDVREKIIRVAKKSMLSERAQKIGRETGAGIYWLSPDKSAEQIKDDQQKLKKIGEILN